MRNLKSLFITPSKRIRQFTGLLFLLLVLMISNNLFGQLESGAYYTISLKNGKVLDATTDGNGNSKITNWNYHGGSNQLFIIHSISNFYLIKSAFNSKFLDVHSSQTSDNAKVSLWKRDPKGSNQHFRLQRVGGYYKIIAMHSNKAIGFNNHTGNFVQCGNCSEESQLFKLDKLDLNSKDYYSLELKNQKVLDVVASSTANGAKVTNYNFFGNDNQLFKLHDLGNGYFNIVARHSGKGLTVDGKKKEDGATIHQWEIVNGAKNQEFFFRKVGRRHKIIARHSGKAIGFDKSGKFVQCGNCPEENQLFELIDEEVQFHMIVASDPQYPRVPTGMNETSAEKKEAERLNRNHVISMNKFIQEKRNVKGVIINGDLTEYGHLYQLRKFKEIYNELKVPKYLGLGNHDYMNNVGETFSNQAANRMVQYMIENIENNKIQHKDYTQKKSYEFPEVVRTITGSLSYSWDVDNVHFVQLQNFPVYEKKWSDYLGSDAERWTVNIKNSLDWLEKDLAKARSEGKVIILNYHDSDEHWVNEGGTTTMINRFTNMLFRYNVGAVFVGHYHPNIGHKDVPNGHASYYKKNNVQIPVFYCGSAIESKYLLVKFQGRRMTVENVNSTNGETRISNSKTYHLY